MWALFGIYYTDIMYIFIFLLIFVFVLSSNKSPSFFSSSYTTVNCCNGNLFKFVLDAKSLYPMSVQSVKKRNGCTLATAHKKIQHTLAEAEKSVKYRVWPGRNKAYFYNTICRETQNSPAKVFTKSAGLPAKRSPLRFFTPRPNTARKFSSCRSDKGY